MKWHQDFPFTPHTNEDLVTALLMVDEVTEENGPLEVWAGTQARSRQPPGTKTSYRARRRQGDRGGASQPADLYLAGAGSVCLMHMRLVATDLRQIILKTPRTLFICVYSAVDAMPISISGANATRVDSPW